MTVQMYLRELFTFSVLLDSSDAAGFIILLFIANILYD